jgi:16S rRNA (guanine527-N7)-methyltransferase
MSEEHVEAILAEAIKYGLSFDAKTRLQIGGFVSDLLSENEVMDLTAITDPEGVAIRHFADSWTLLPLLDEITKSAGMKTAPTLLDVGSGAGFPGLAVKLVRPLWNVVLLDSRKKRVDFLRRTLVRQGITGVDAVWGRAEEIAREEKYRDQFDVVTARAVASLPVIAELCLPFVKAGGSFIAMRGKTVTAPEQIEALSAVREKTVELDLSGMERCLIVYRKEGMTKKRYPRPYAAIVKKPLFLPD